MPSVIWTLRGFACVGTLFGLLQLMLGEHGITGFVVLALSISVLGGLSVIIELGLAFALGSARNPKEPEGKPSTRDGNADETG